MKPHDQNAFNKESPIVTAKDYEPLIQILVTI
jgi:hypothetical protein